MIPGFCLSHEANYTKAAHQTKAQALFRQGLAAMEDARVRDRNESEALK
jgi:hypothetical protein